MLFRRKPKPDVQSSLQFRLFDKITVEVPPSFASKKRVINALKQSRYEAEEARALQAHLTADDRLLELGSGIGVLGALAAQTLPATNITCVEANEALLPVIRTNLDRNGASAATLLHGAVCSDPAASEIDFHIGPKFTAASLSAEGRGSYQTHRVPALRFADVLDQAKPTFIMCDVEGAERDLIETKLPASVRFLCLELHLVWLGDLGIQQFFEAMHSQGFAYHPKGSSGGIVCFKRITDDETIAGGL
ncbi:MAG: FkbM family methyltransferase [Pseudomonadota bacterium]